MLVWLPEYKIIRHRRARSVKFRVTSNRELKITIPYRFSIKHLPSILEEHRDWIISHVNKIPIRNNNPPTFIELPAIGKTWQITYKNTAGKLKLMEGTNEIIIFGSIDNNPLCITLLKKWVKQKATDYLSSKLQEVSNQTHLPYKKLTVRSQRSMWGSCTSSHAISLNYKLIFLPSELVRHVLIHELCHTKHLNHSHAFWRLVAEYDPLWKQHTRLLKRGDSYIPAWIL